VPEEDGARVSEIPPVGVAVLMLKNERVYLAKRLQRDKPFFGAWATAGGKPDGAELPRETAIRELKEETGLIITDKRRLFYGDESHHKYEDGRPFTMHWFYIELYANEAPRETEPEKQGPWTLFERADLPPLLTPGTMHALGMITAVRCWALQGGQVVIPIERAIQIVRERLAGRDTFECDALVDRFLREKET
jgi:ADP-ribose pyrophosphatase YjhB (NUDIX family)